MVFLEPTKGNLMGALNDDCLLDWLILQILVDPTEVQD
jgi:hypothetical protein